MLEQYRHVIPDLPEKLLEMAQQEVSHRRRIEHKLINSQVGLEVFRGIIALVALGSILFAAYMFMLNGHPLHGATVAGIAIAIVGIFVTKKVINKQSSNE